MTLNRRSVRKSSRQRSTRPTSPSASSAKTGDGSNGAPSYMTLAAPDKKDFSTIVVNDIDQAPWVAR